MHRAFKCPQACERLFQPCGHACPCLRGDPCGLCKTKIKDAKLPCGHTKDEVNCHQVNNLDAVQCTVLVQKRIPVCAHDIEVPCCRDVAVDGFHCPQACITTLDCGHQCPGTCGICKTQHQQCTRICGRRLGSCNHTCPETCHPGRSCGSCSRPCEVQCTHSHCDQMCHEPCAPCIQRCTWNCEHQGECNMPCAAPCNRLPCSKRCSEVLTCGHQCPSLCGEICPSEYCQDCSGKGGEQVDLIEFKDYSEIDLNSTPIVVLGCGHFFTAEGLDGHVRMSEVYKTNSAGEIVGLRDIPAEMAERVPQCPNCQRPIQQYATQRYNRAINRAVIDEMSRRFLVSGKGGLDTLEGKVNDLEPYLEETKQSVVNLADDIGGDTRPEISIEASRQLEARVKKSDALTKLVPAFLNSVTEQSQPVRKLHDATHKSIRALKPVHEQMAQLSVSSITPISPDRRILLGGRALQLKLDSVIIADEMQYQRMNDYLEDQVSAVIAPIFPCQPVFSHFAFSRVIWTLNYTTKTPLLYHLFSTLSGEAIGIK